MCIRDRLDVGADFDLRAEGEDFFGDGAGGDAANGLAGGGAAAALVVAEAEFGEVGRCV